MAGRPLALAAALALLAACAEAPPPQGPAAGRGCPAGDVRVSSTDDLARLRGCRDAPGDVVITGGALEDLDPLASLRRVGGTLRIGPTFRLASAAGLGALRRVEGSLEILDNADLGGFYARELALVGGDLVVDNNFSLRGLSLHALEAVGGGVAITRNDALLRADLGALERVEGRLEVTQNRALETLDRGALRETGGEVEVRANPNL